jgi:hypothetical protein
MVVAKILREVVNGFCHANHFEPVPSRQAFLFVTNKQIRSKQSGRQVPEKKHHWHLLN